MAIFNFEPQVWTDTIRSFMREKFTLYQLAYKDYTMSESAGITTVFPFYEEAPGEAQVGVPGVRPVPFYIQNNSFNVVVNELTDAAAITDYMKMNAATRASARSGAPGYPMSAAEADLLEEICRQFARRFTKAITTNLKALLEDPLNSTLGFLATTATDFLTTDILERAKVEAFGDLSNQADVIVCHSKVFQSYISSVSGLDAFKMNAIRQDLQTFSQFRGMFQGVNFLVEDDLPSTVIDGRTAYTSYIFKPKAYGIYEKQGVKVESVRDIGLRVDEYVGTMWYGSLSLHKKVSPQDARICKIVTVV